MNWAKEDTAAGTTWLYKDGPYSARVWRDEEHVRAEVTTLAASLCGQAIFTDESVYETDLDIRVMKVKAENVVRTRRLATREPANRCPARW